MVMMSNTSSAYIRRAIRPCTLYGCPLLVRGRGASTQLLPVWTPALGSPYPLEGPSQRRAYQVLWAQEVRGGHLLSQYGMSRLMPPTAPAPSSSPKEDWKTSDEEAGELDRAWEEVDLLVFGRLALEDPEPADQVVSEAVSAGAHEPWDP